MGLKGKLGSFLLVPFGMCGQTIQKLNALMLHCQRENDVV